MRVAVGFAAVVLAAGIVVSAQAPSKDPAKSQACSLMTKEDAAAALGEAVNGPTASSMPGGPSTCSYTGSGIHEVTLNVIPLTNQNAATYKAMCAQKTRDGLTGLGDVTCWYNDKHAELQVLKGLNFLSIELRKGGDPTEAIKGVARKAYERLK